MNRLKQSRIARIHRALERLQRELPPASTALLRIPGLGLKRVLPLLAQTMGRQP